MSNEAQTADRPAPDGKAAKHPSPHQRARAALLTNRSKLWRTSPLRPVRFSHCLVFLVALGLAWRVIRYALGFPIWGDEAFVAVNFFERDFAGMIEPLIYGQIVPLMFMWIELAVSRALGYSEWALHLPPFLAGIAAVPLFWWFASRTLKPRAAFVAIGVFAAAYYTVRHAAEIKPYSFDLLVSLGLTMLGWSVYTRSRSADCADYAENLHTRSRSAQRGRRVRGPDATPGMYIRPRAAAWRWVALILLAGLAPWCSYTSVFVSGAVGLLLAGLLWRKKLRPAILIGWLTFAVIAGGSFVWMYVVYGHPHAEAASELVQIDMWAKTFPPLLNPWKFVLWFFYMHMGRMLAYPVGGAAPASIVTFAMVVVGGVHLWRSRRRALLWLLLGPLALTFIAACFHKYPYGGSARTTQYLAPAFCILMGLGVFVTLRRLMAGPRLAVSIRLFGVFCAGVAVVGAVKDIAKPYKSDRTLKSHQTVLEVAERSGPTDRWIIFNATEQVSYAPYIGELRGTGSQFAFNVMRFCPGTVEWAPPPESVARRPGDGNVWLLAYHGSRSDLKDNAEFEAFEAEFSRQFEAYLTSVSQSLGPASEHEDIFIHTRVRDGRERRESLDVYRFGR